MNKLVRPLSVEEGTEGKLSDSGKNLMPTVGLSQHPIQSWKVLEAKRVVIYVGLWALELSVSMVVLVFFECFSEVLFRCEQLPFASQSVRLELV